MKTPKKYTDNLNRRIITRGMLEDCILSINVRARYINSQINEIWNGHKYLSESNFKTVKSLKGERERLYAIKKRVLKLIKTNGVLVCEKTGRVYKTYNLGGDNSFCLPVKKKYLNSYKGTIKYITCFVPSKGDMSDLLSIQFVNKLYELIQSRDYILDYDLKPFLKKDYLERYGRE